MDDYRDFESREVIHNFSECFLGYKINITKDELGLKDSYEKWPRIYLERNDDTERLFFTFPDWYEPIPSMAKTDAELVYDKVHIYFEAGGTDAKKIPELARKEKMVSYNNKLSINIELTKDMISRSEYRYIADTVVSFNGVGQFVLEKAGKKSILYFAINHVVKKRIYYSIDDKKIEFETRANIDKIKVKLLTARGRVPCLRDDLIRNNSINSNESIEVSFKNGHASIKKEQVKAKDDISEQLRYFVEFAGNDDELSFYNKNYLLVCAEDCDRAPSRINYRTEDPIAICPYCNKPIMNLKDETRFLDNRCRRIQKKKYGVYCNGGDVEDLTIYNSNGRREKGVMVCYRDCAGDDESARKAPPKRMLPKDILERRNYRLAILGYSRSGKSTLISRMLNITGNENDINILPIQGRLEKVYKLSYWASPLLSNSLDDLSIIPGNVPQNNNCIIKSTPFYKNKDAYGEANAFMSNYSIDIDKKSFTSPTEINDIPLHNPFILDINKKAYLSIYDIAGEAVQEEDLNCLTPITSGDNIGLFLIIDPSLLDEDLKIIAHPEDKESQKKRRKNNKYCNSDIIQLAAKNYAHTKEICPVAVIVTKFDMIEQEFSPSCACLRGDYSSLYTKTIESSSLLEHIDRSSDEIESYLKDKGIDIRDNPEMLEGFNVKFFGVSSITYKDALFHVDNDDKSKETNALNFGCRPKRIELPFIWMLHALGEI